MTELVPPVILSRRHPGEAGGYSTRRPVIPLKASQRQVKQRPNDKIPARWAAVSAGPTAHGQLSSQEKNEANNINHSSRVSRRSRSA